MVAWLKRLVGWLLPAKCVGCNRLGDWWCTECQARVVVVTNPTCQRCRTLTPIGQYCKRCRRYVSLTGILAGAHFRDPIPQAIKALKYKSTKTIAGQLAKYQLAALKRLPQKTRCVLVPVPLHRAKQRERGFNQSELLSSAVAARSDLPVAKALERIRPTQSQTGLAKKERIRNVAEAFRIRKNTSIKGKVVLLVDDVATTGATLNACATACRQAGARQVWGLVVAKG